MLGKLYNIRCGLKKARKRKGLTQGQLAEIMEVIPKTVMNWEQGITNPDLETLIKLSGKLDCDLDYLTGRLTEPTHDLQFIHEQTGLSCEAIKKLQSKRDLSFMLSMLIEHDESASLIWKIIDGLCVTECDVFDDARSFGIYRSLMNLLSSISAVEFFNKLISSCKRSQCVSPEKSYSALFVDAVERSVSLDTCDLIRLVDSGEFNDVPEDKYYEKMNEIWAPVFRQLSNH